MKNVKDVARKLAKIFSNRKISINEVEGNINGVSRRAVLLALMQGKQERRRK